MLLLDNFTPLVLSSVCFSREAQNKLGEIKDERLLQEDFFFFFFPTVSCSSLFVGGFFCKESVISGMQSGLKTKNKQNNM